MRATARVKVEQLAGVREQVLKWLYAGGEASHI